MRKKGRIIFLAILVFLGIFSFPKAVFAQEGVEPQIKIIVEDEKESFILNSKAFYNINTLQEYLGDGDNNGDENKGALYFPTWTFYVHSGTKGEGLGNFLARKWYSEVYLTGKENLTIKASIYLNDVLIGDGITFLKAVKPEEEFLTEPGIVYINTCAGEDIRLIFQINTPQEEEK